MLRLFQLYTFFPAKRYPTGRDPENCTSTGTFLAANRVRRSRSCDGTARKKHHPRRQVEIGF